MASRSLGLLGGLVARWELARGEAVLPRYIPDRALHFDDSP